MNKFASLPIKGVTGESMFCPKCGAKATDTDTFCGSCGASLAKKATVDQPAKPSPVQPANSAPVFSVAPTSVPIPSPAPTGQAAASSSKKLTSNRNKIIGAAALVALLLIIVICIYMFFFATKPSYVIKRSVNDLGNTSTEVSYERDESGMIIKSTYITDGKSETYSYKELADGLSIEKDTTGKYEKNSDGYLSYIEVNDSSGKLRYSRSYEYYNAGVIKSITQRDGNGGSTTTVYDEDGWWTSSKSTDSKGNVTEYTCEYSFSDDGRSVTASRIGKTNSSTTESVVVYDLDETGNVVAMFVEGQSSSRISYTLEKIDYPDKMVAATARLKQ